MTFWRGFFDTFQHALHANIRQRLNTKTYFRYRHKNRIQAQAQVQAARGAFRAHSGSFPDYRIQLLLQASGSSMAATQHGTSQCTVPQFSG